MNETKNRCRWVNLKNPSYVAYHDQEWGVPLHDDRALFELLILEGFQAGLSWECVLNKRERFREAYDGFDPETVSRYDEEKCQRLLADPGIIRNRLKVQASVTNAKIFLEIQAEYGSFDAYIWCFTDGKTLRESYDLRTTSPLSDRISKDLRKRGMKFVGSTVIYSYLQAIGILNAHGPECDWSKENLTGEVTDMSGVQKDYSDIIGLPHHVSEVHPPMSIEARAAQFSPFAALSGYEDAARETARRTARKIQLSEEEQAAVDFRLRQAYQAGARVEITYFLPDPHKDGGAYVTAAGRIKKLDGLARIVALDSGDRIPAGDILEIETEA